MAYPINPNARAQSTYDGISLPSSTVATAELATCHSPDSSDPPSVIINGYVPTHPYHFYPTLFPPPTSALPLHPSPTSPLAPLYHTAVRAGQQWSAHLETWSASTHEALSRPPPDPHRAACSDDVLHPHHFLPWLFDEPTEYLPLVVPFHEPLAGLYEDTLRAGQEWLQLRREWAVAEEWATGRADEESGWVGEEEAAEADGLWEQERLDGEREGDYAVLEDELRREWERMDEGGSEVS
ncbi:hypothetical protein MMC26_003512 [Xylographa opegraphella]|nr:hypothetical protein [Xylographa opegraphella]